MKFSPAALAAVLPKDEAVKRLWVGLSGGLDSMVLLHALVALRQTLPVMALHVNHQISPHAKAWEVHCAAFCKAFQIPFFTEAVVVKPQGRGLEDAARVARYQVYEGHLQQGDLLLTAHHADDQTETLLLRLLRGAGPRGLAAMSRSRPLAKGHIFRPLLDFTRADLEAYAQAHQLHWVEDESNRDVHYDRNFLRHEIIPPLQERWPQLQQYVQRTADLCADNEVLLTEVAAEDLARLDVRAERVGQSLDLTALQQWSPARRHNLLRYWLRTEQFEVPERVHLSQFERQLVAGREDSEARIHWGNLVLRRYRGRLYVEPHGAVGTSALTYQPFMLGADSSVVKLSSGGALQFEYVQQASGSDCLRADLQDLSVRARTGGERCQPEGRAHSQTLKKLLQEYALEPWWRDQLPLVYAGEQLVAVGDLWVCKGFAASPGQPGYRLRWQLQSVADGAHPWTRG